MDIKVFIKRVGKKADRLPLYATEDSAGFDLSACIDESVTIQPGSRVLIPTGIAISIEEKGYAAFLFARSGLSVKHGIALSNGVGVIDRDYRGEIKVGLINQSDKAYTVNPGDRIAQAVLLPTVHGILFETDNLEQTARSDGGFGSTGK